MRILEVIDLGIRKLMRGFDNFVVGGSQVFDDFKNIVRVLGQFGKGYEWLEKMISMFNEGVFKSLV